MKFFSVDSPLYKFISTFWVVVKLEFFLVIIFIAHCNNRGFDHGSIRCGA